MKRKYVFASLVVGAMSASGVVASAATLFTTQEDFSGWSGGNAATISALGDQDGSTINGVGNTTAPGATGTAGAMAITIASGSTFGATLSPGEQANTAFINAISEQQVSVDYIANVSGGNYFQLLLLLNGQTSGYTTLTPTLVTNGAVTTATYTLPAVSTSQTYLQFGFVANTNNVGTVTVDNIRTVPEPAGLVIVGGVGVLGLRRRRE